ncbi:molecular chaperone DnaK, partial [bacterium]|nr:molecular chaperone DnaK [bacterium]
YGDKVDDETKGKIEAAVGRVKEALKGSNIDEIKSATDALNQIWQDAASKMYAQTAGAQDDAQAQGEPADGKQAGPEKDENVQDADFEVVDDDK